ncbi:MAG: FeS-binding protein [Dehalococcoidales bacterium]|nr:FeS-binding protein [Dehalococcoidales bacterium]
MTKRRVMLNFTTELLVEPITYNLGQQFNLVINILRAEVTEDGGWLILELEGGGKDMDDGITWVISKGARVDPSP